MKVGDKVEIISVICEVIEIKDIEGYERVKIKLPSEFLGLTRYYDGNELVKERDG